MKLLTIVIATAMTVPCYAQSKAIINGKVAITSGSSNIRIGSAVTPVNKDGSFHFEMEVKGPSSELIRTDSSGATSIWIEPGAYNITCDEHQGQYNGKADYILLVKKVLGPADAKLFNYHQQQIWSNFKAYTGRIKNSKLSAEALQKEGAMLFMDSLLAANTTSPVLPQIIRWTHRFVGDDNTIKYIQTLPSNLQKDSDLMIVQKDINRNKKLATERLFENFTLQDVNGKPFTLSDLKEKKAVLISFWESDCGPCRLTHPRLKEWYKKYKDKGLEIVSVSIDYKKDKWLEAIKKDGIESFINVVDSKGWDADLMINYFIPFIPFKFLLNGKREIIGVYPGYTPSEKEIVALLEK